MGERAFILGHPVAHSKSPLMHDAAYEALGLKWEYGFADCATEADARVFLNVRNWRAINITMPWKPLAFEAADERSVAAKLALGANVLVNWGGRLHADNTDGKGCAAFLRRCGISLEGVCVAVCGTGPTSLSIMHACACAGARHVALLGRDYARAERVLSDYRERLEAAKTAAALRGQQSMPDFAVLDEAEFCAFDYANGLESLENAQVIVDATPLGMHEGDPAPFDVSVLSAGQTVLDVVYGHGETALLAAARAAGCNTYDGAGMLVAQAVETVHDIAAITGMFAVPAHMDLFSIMSDAAGF